MANESNDPRILEALGALLYRATEEGYRPPLRPHISLGGCMSAIGTERQGAFRRQAHAHNHRGTGFGWLCFLSAKPERLITQSGKPTALLIHEYAHLCVRDGHGPRWQRAVSALGAPAEARRQTRRQTGGEG